MVLGNTILVELLRVRFLHVFLELFLILVERFLLSSVDFVDLLCSLRLLFSDLILCFLPTLFGLLEVLPVEC